MTVSPGPPAPPRSAAESKPTFFRRRFVPLIVIWLIALGIAGLIYWFEKWMPAFHEVVTPLYWIIGALTLYVTWKWVRTRSKGDRRNLDRRRLERRDTSDHPVEPPGS